MSDSRKQFEEWYEAQMMPCESDWFRRDNDAPDEYDSSNTHSAWLAWSARDSEVERLMDALNASTEMLQECADEFGAGPMTVLGQQISANKALLSSQVKESGK